MRRRSSLLLCLLGVLSLLPVAVAKAKLVYRCGANLCQAGDDGSNRVQLTSGSDVLYSPDLSADGSRVAFFRVDRGAHGAFVLDLESGRRSSVGTGDVDDVQMRPDGQRVAVSEFSGSSVGPGRLCYYDVFGGGRSCEDAGLGVFGQDYRPDGRLVTLVRSGSGSGAGSRVKLCLRVADGSGQSGCEQDLVVDDSRFLRDPAVSPDGRLLAVTVTTGADNALGTIALYSLDTGAFVRGVSSGPQDSEPAWTADSRHVLFTRGRNTESPSIWSVAAEGPAGSEELVARDGVEPTASAPVTLGAPVSGLKVGSPQRGVVVRAGVRVGFDDTLVVAVLRYGKKVVGRLARSGLRTGRVSLRVRLNAAGRRALGKRGRLGLRLSVTGTAPSGAKKTVSKRLTLRRR